MGATATKPYRLIKKVKDESFDVDELHDYSLSLMIGIRDFQFCVTNSESKVLILEDFKLERIKTINTRIKVLQEIFDNHHLLSAGFWKNVKVAFKSHKYTLVPSNVFLPESAVDYLAVNSEIKPSIESVHYYKHIGSDAINVFTGDHRLLKWLNTIYPPKNIHVVHQGSALVEGIQLYDDHNGEKGMFVLIDRGVLHIVVCENRDLLYYNQFAVRKPQEYLKYIMLVFKELQLNQRSSNVTIWGNLKRDSETVGMLKKYIRNISFGSRPAKIKFGYQFDEILDHQYFDLLNVYLCE